MCYSANNAMIHPLEHPANWKGDWRDNGNTTGGSNSKNVWFTVRIEKEKKSLKDFLAFLLLFCNFALITRQLCIFLFVLENDTI